MRTAFTKARVGALLICPEGDSFTRRAQAAPTGRSSAQMDDSRSDVRKAVAVSTTTFANYAENSLLGEDAMNSTLLFIKTSSPGCDSWEATPNGRAGGVGVAAAPASDDGARARGVSWSRRPETSCNYMHAKGQPSLR